MKQKQAFSIIYENDDLVAVNKSPGISVVGDRWDESRERLDDLLNLHYAQNTAAGPALGPAAGFRLFTVHRIDRDTSGLVLFAKNAETHKTLSRAFESRAMEKNYIAVIYGRPAWEETACDIPLIPDGDKKHRTIADRYRGKKSLTRFRLMYSAGNYSVVEAMPETGRTHQIRVHLASLGHPVVCDTLYGKSGAKGIRLSSFKPSWRGDPYDEKPLLDRLGLHAAGLKLQNPALDLRAPLPRDLNALIKQMEKNAHEQ